MTNGAPLLQLEFISKSFPGARALSNVCLTLRAGEVLGLVGENGAGKSTLLKILGGILFPDDGEIVIDGNPTRIRSVRHAQMLGIGFIHQELNLASDMTIAENLYLGKQPYRGPRWLRFTNRRKMNSDAARELNRVGLRVSPKEVVDHLDIARRQLVEIARALATQARVLVLDEPTSSLSSTEADRLLSILDDLKRRSVSIIYVSHRLGEVERIADHVAVLRDGVHVGSLAKGDISQQRMISLMVGRDLKSLASVKTSKPQGQNSLTVENLRLTRKGACLSLQVRSGEIVGLAGIVGAGRTEMVRAIFGIDRFVGGQTYICGRRVDIRRPGQAMAAGLALVPEDRKAFGIILDLPVCSNVSLAILSRLATWGRYNRRGERALARQYKKSLNIKCASLATKATLLSGGNQQKVVLAKWLATDPKVLILDEPTRGVDIGGKQEIYRLIRDLASRGMAVLLISSEMDEIIGMSDRVLIMRSGSIVGELTGTAVSEESIMRLAVGVS